MPKPDLPKPTDAELAILRVLWHSGPSTVREVWEQLNVPRQNFDARASKFGKRTGYTTVLKLLQIMFEKGLVTRDASRRSHVFAAALTETRTQQQVVGHLLDRVFGGSAQRLVMQALSVKKASPAELAEIRKLLDKLEGGGK